VEDRFGRWMAAAQGGDSEAYERLLRALVPLLRRFVGALLRDPPAVDDVVQEVLLRIHRARHSYRPERPFGPWLRTIARHAAIDALRERSRRGRHERPAEAAADAEPMVEASEPGSDRLSPELARALAGLPAAQRQALELLHLEALPLPEAATRAGSTPGALKLRAHRALHALRRSFVRSET
jgi:RNA polymerase sigma-70 factor (ECF subfamily)